MRVGRVRRIARQLWKLCLYFVIPAVSALAPLMVIPAIVARFGPGGWASVAVALSVGGTCAVVAELGWGVVGPQEIARRPDRAHDLYQSSVASKLLAVGGLAPIAAGIAALLGGEQALAAAAIAAASVTSVLSPAWFFVGRGRPLTVLVTDTTPRVATSVAAAALILLGAPLVTYGLMLLLGSALAYVAAAALGGLRAWPSRAAFAEAPALIRRQVLVIAGRAVSTVYTSLPTSLLGWVSPASTGLFSSIDRPMRMGLTILGGVPSRLQSWVGTPKEDLIPSRALVSIWMNCVLGLVAGAFFAVAAPTVVRLLFAGGFHVGYALSALEGALAALICSSRGFGLALVAVGRANSITAAIVAGAITGGVGLLVLAPAFGAAGAISALIAAELVGILVQARQLRGVFAHTGLIPLLPGRRRFPASAVLVD